MRTDIAPETMDLPELFDRLSARDARVMRKILNVMIDWNISLPLAFTNIEVFWDTKGWYDMAAFAGFEKALDQWIEAGKRYG